MTSKSMILTKRGGEVNATVNCAGAYTTQQIRVKQDVIDARLLASGSCPRWAGIEESVDEYKAALVRSAT